jgi:hypothetical protein
MVMIVDKPMGWHPAAGSLCQVPHNHSVRQGGWGAGRSHARLLACDEAHACSLGTSATAGSKLCASVPGYGACLPPVCKGWHLLAQVLLEAEAKGRLQHLPAMLAEMDAQQSKCPRVSCAVLQYTPQMASIAADQGLR